MRWLLSVIAVACVAGLALAGDGVAAKKPTPAPTPTTTYVDLTDRVVALEAEVATLRAEVDELMAWYRLYSEGEDYMPAPIYDVTDYGAVGDGETDDYGAIQDAIDAAGTSGGTIYFPVGTYYLNESSAGGLKLPPSNTAWLSFYGYGATIKLSANVPRFLDFDRTADYQNFDWFAVRGFDIDANNVTGSHHVVIGGYMAAAHLRRVNIRHLRFRDLHVYNAPVTGSVRFGIALMTYHAAEAESVTNTIEDIVVENYTQEGGCCAVCVSGLNYGHGAYPDDTRIEIDAIDLSNIWWDSGVTGADRVVSSGIQVGGLGRLGTCHINGAYLKGSGDNLIEINNARNALVEDVDGYDAKSGAFYCTNYGYPLGINEGDEDQTDQSITWRDCIYDVTDGGEKHAFWIGPDGRRGTITYDACGFNDTGADAACGDLFWSNASAVFEAINITDCTYTRSGFSSSGNIYPNIVYLTSAGNGDGDPPLITIEGLSLNFSGTRNGTDAVTVRGIICGGKTALALDDCAFAISLTNAATSGIRVLDIGKGITGITCDGLIENSTLDTAGDSAAFGAYIGTDAELTIPTTITFDYCDFSAIEGTAVSVGSGNTEKVIETNCTY